MKSKINEIEVDEFFEENLDQKVIDLGSLENSVELIFEESSFLDEEGDFEELDYQENDMDVEDDLEIGDLDFFINI